MSFSQGMTETPAVIWTQQAGNFRMGNELLKTDSVTSFFLTNIIILSQHCEFISQLGLYKLQY